MSRTHLNASAATGGLGSRNDLRAQLHSALAAQYEALNDEFSLMSNTWLNLRRELASTQNHRACLQRITRNAREHANEIRANANTISAQVNTIRAQARANYHEASMQTREAYQQADPTRVQAHETRDQALRLALQVRQHAREQARDSHALMDRARSHIQIRPTQRQRGRRTTTRHEQQRNAVRRPRVRELSAAASALPTQLYTQEQNDARRSDNQCRICLEQLVVNEEVKTLPCFHLFHSHCVDRWLCVNERCPVCRTNLDDSTLGY